MSEARDHKREADCCPGRPLPTTCRLCGKPLKTYERPEGECDACLRARQMRPAGMP
jgi:hypothetical protein